MRLLGHGNGVGGKLLGLGGSRARTGGGGLGGDSHGGIICFLKLDPGCRDINVDGGRLDGVKRIDDQSGGFIDADAQKLGGKRLTVAAGGSREVGKVAGAYLGHRLLGNAVGGPFHGHGFRHNGVAGDFRGQGLIDNPARRRFQGG